MPEKYVPKHRNAPPKRVRTGAKKAVFASGAALFATGLTVSAGVAASGQDSPTDGDVVNLAAGQAHLAAQTDLADRAQGASRSTADRRGTTDPAKVAALSDDAGVAVTRTVDLTKADPKTLARALMPQYGLDPAEFGCVDNIYMHESKWDVHADNPYSSAYGIPQALPGSKMASAGPDWENNAETQIRWGLKYIADRYGSACSAWSFKQSHGWY